MDIFSEGQDQIDTRRGNKYFFIARELKRRIDHEEILSRLPSLPQICEEFSTTPVTAHKAIGLLKQVGLVTSTKGHGTFVTRLKRVRTNVIEAILHGPSSASPLHAALSQGFQEACVKNGQRGVITYHSGDAAKSKSLIKEAWEARAVDGFVLWPTQTPGTRVSLSIRYMQEEGIPFVLVPHPEPDLYKHSHQVVTEQLTVAEALMAHLLQKGHTRIVFVAWTGFEKANHGRIRYQAYTHMMTQAGLKGFPPLKFQVQSQTAIGPNSKGVSASKLKQYTAAFCVTDGVAAHVCRVCLEAGIRSPGDLEVTGYDNNPESMILNFSTVDQQFDKIGSRSAELLLREIEGELDGPVVETVHAKPIFR